MASKQEINEIKAKQIAKALKDDIPLDKAINYSLYTTHVRLDVPILKSQKKNLEKKYNKYITTILMDVLKGEIKETLKNLYDKNSFAEEKIVKKQIKDKPVKKKTILRKK